MKQLTKEQAALIGCFTGISFGPFEDVHALAEKTLGRPIFTHELASEDVWCELRKNLKTEIEKIAYIGVNQ